MPVTKVACPYCGESTNATFAPDSKFLGVDERDDQGGRGVTRSQNSCQNCGRKFYSYYEA
jgi:DNA-directed RNA polymerase subunit RPC12/RpoP